MDSQTLLALAAVVIGIAALVIALGQLVQQIFGTVDGYRRCQSSVIGPWSRKTRLVWRWTQFRFETKFTTPEIVLYEPPDSYREVYPLIGGDMPRELQQTIFGQESDKERYDGDMVTWTTLLKQLYRHQKTWHRPIVPETSSRSSTEKDSSPSHHDGSRARVIGVIYRERTWDLMSPEIIRPMASSRLGTVIVLAHRLGMRWDVLDSGEIFMHAEGNGHSLTASMLNGIGLVFQYSFSHQEGSAKMVQYFTERSRFSADGNMISTASEKMMCGIIPGCLALGLYDIPLEGKGMAENSALLFGGLMRVGVEYSIAREISNPDILTGISAGKGWSEPCAFSIHEFIALIAPFLPCTENCKTQIVWPLRASVTLSSFLFDHCRKVLLKVLEERERSPHLEEVFRRLKRLEQEFSDDFYTRWDKAIVNPNNRLDNLRPNLIKATGEIHDWTGDYFKRVDKNIPYTELVSEHVALAYRAAKRAREIRPKSLRLFYKENAKQYIEMQPELVQGVQDRLERTGGVGVSSLAIEEAWWTLMLRGTAWVMSVWIVFPDYRVPSKLYYNQTPCFIT